MLRYSSNTIKRASYRTRSTRAFSTPQPLNNAKKAGSGPESESKGNENNNKSNYGNTLFQMTIAFIVIDVMLADVVYKMNKDESFDKSIEARAPQPIYRGLKLLQSWGRGLGLLSIPKEKANPIINIKPERLPPKKNKVVEPPKPPKVDEPPPVIAEVVPEPIPAPKPIPEPVSTPAPEPSQTPVAVEEHVPVAPDSTRSLEFDEMLTVDQTPTEPSAPLNAIIDEPKNEVLLTEQPPINQGSDGVIPILPSEAVAKSLKSDTADTIINEMVTQFHALRKDFEDSLLKDLHSMDEQTLRYKYIQLATEFFERNKWEGIRMQQAMKQLEAEIAVKYLELMRQQRVELESQIQAIHVKKELELLELSINQSEDAKQTLKEEVEKLTKAHEKSFDKRVKGDVEKHVNTIRQQLEDDFNHQLAVEREALMKKQQAHLNDIEELRMKLVAIYHTIDDTTVKKAISIDLHRLSSAVLSLERMLQSPMPIGSYVTSVKSLSGSNELINSAVEAIPADMLARGSPMLPDLKLRFAVVRNEVRKAALAPAGVPTFLGQVLGNGLAAISWAPKGYVSGEGIEEILARTEFYLDQGQLKEAVREVEQIQGYAGELLSDWKKLATNRLIADQVAKLLRAEATLQHHSFP
jgi:hypothetical protein